MAYEVHVLYAGYSGTTEHGMSANCSCTLIRGRHNIIVDTMTPWDKDKIVSALARHKLTPDDIHFIVCTHGHSDHVGNNNLFLRAKHIVGYSVSFRDTYSLHPFEEGHPFVIDDDVKVIPTPGHTNADVSVIVRTPDMGTVAIVGDLFEREEDIENPSLWREVGGSENPRIQERYRNAILLMADHIVPGHGPMFAVTPAIRDDANKKSALATGHANYLPPSFINSGFVPPGRIQSHMDATDDHCQTCCSKPIADRDKNIRDWPTKRFDFDGRPQTVGDFPYKQAHDPRAKDWNPKSTYESGSRTLDERIVRDEYLQESKDSWESRTRTTDDLYGREARKRISDNKPFRDDGPKPLMEGPGRDTFDKRPDDRFGDRFGSRFGEDKIYEDRLVLGRSDKFGRDDKFGVGERFSRFDRQGGVGREEVRYDRITLGDRTGIARDDLPFNKDQRLGLDDKLSSEDRFASDKIFTDDKLDDKFSRDLKLDRSDRLFRDDRYRDDKFSRPLRDGKLSEDKFGEDDRLKDKGILRDRGREDWSRADRSRVLDFPERRSKFGDDKAADLRLRSLDGPKDISSRILDDKIGRREDRTKRDPRNESEDILRRLT